MPSRIEHDGEVAAAAVTRYGLPPDRRLRLINLSENATYLVEDGVRATILRVHREGYHSRAAIESELDWLAAVGAEAGVATAAVIPATDGERVVTVPVDGRARHAVMFERLPGAEPAAAALGPAGFATLGAITARLHRHSRGWTRPAGFTRFAWDWAHALGAEARWGRWQDGVAVGPAQEAVLGAAADIVRDRLAAFGDGPDRYGLVHADLRLANLIVDGDRIAAIDFDDCGFSWFGYDFAAAVSFLEHDPRIPQWQAAWLSGYRTEAPLAAADERMLPTFVMLRRLMLVAWMGSHPHSRECQEIGPSYTAGSCELADRYVRSGGHTLHEGIA